MKALTCLLLFVSMAASAEEASYTAARAAMVEELRRYAQIVDDPDEARISDAVMASMNTVKRHELVPQSGEAFRLRKPAVADRVWPDDFATLHRRAHDGTHRARCR